MIAVCEGGKEEARAGVGYRETIFGRPLRREHLHSREQGGSGKRAFQGDGMAKAMILQQEGEGRIFEATAGTAERGAAEGVYERSSYLYVLWRSGGPRSTF